MVSDFVGGEVNNIPIIATFFGRSIPLLAISSVCELPLTRSVYGQVHERFARCNTKVEVRPCSCQSSIHLVLIGLTSINYKEKDWWGL